MSSDNFYVYIIFDPRFHGPFVYEDLCFDYEPFYVGKGSGKRIKQTLKYIKNNPYKKNKINKILETHTPLVIKIRDGLTLEKSCELEIELIKKIGKYNLGNGPLTNITDGGEGVPGLKQSKEHVEKRLLSVIGRKHSEEENQKVSNWHKGKTTAKDKEGNKFYADIEDPRWKTGEIFGASKGHKKRSKTIEEKKILSEKLKGRIPWNKGLKGEKNKIV